MPVPIIAGIASVAGGVVKGVKKVGEFFGNLFGGKKKRQERRLRRLAVKEGRLVESSYNTWKKKIEKAEFEISKGSAKAKVRLAKIRNQLTKKGLNPEVLDSLFGTAAAFEVPQGFEKTRLPQQMQMTTEQQIADKAAQTVLGRRFGKRRQAGAAMASMEGGAGFFDKVIGWVKENPVPSLGIGAALVYFFKGKKL